MLSNGKVVIVKTEYEQFCAYQIMEKKMKLGDQAKGTKCKLETELGAKNSSKVKDFAQ